MASQYMIPGFGFINDRASGASYMIPGFGFAHEFGIPLTGTLAGVASRTTLIEGQGVHFYLPGDTVIESAVPIGASGRRDWSQVDVHWDFGDSATELSGTWTHSGKLQAEDTGVSAAHVYETAGSFTVTATIRIAGVTYTYSVGVVVSAFSGTDYFFDTAGGLDANDGLTSGTAKQFLTNFRTAYLALAANTRINLKAGQTHVVSSAWSRTGTATFNIVWGRYSTGANPVISTSGCTGGWIIGGIATENTVFIDVDGAGTATDAFTRPGKNWTFLRCTWTGFDSGSTTSSVHGNKQFVFFQEVNIGETESYNIYFNHGQKSAILGCTFNGVDSVSGEHLNRTYLTQSVPAHSRYKFPRSSKHVLKFVGYFPTGDPLRAGTEGTETVIHSCIHDNVVDEIRLGCDFPFDLGPVDASKDERTQDCFCYNNVMSMSNTIGDCDAQAAIIVRNEDWTLYNNVIDLSQIPTCDGVRVNRRGVEPVPTRNRVYNTTVYSSVAFTGPAVTVSSGAVDSVVFNTFLVRLSGGTNLSDAGTNTSSGTNVTATSGLTSPGGVTGVYTQVAGSGGLATGTSLAPRVMRYRDDTLRAANLDTGADAVAEATVAPTVTTDVIADITATTADCGGNVTSDGGASVTTRGICWNTLGSPTTADTIAASGTGTGTFDADLSGLTASTTYHVRAYATNSVGTSYGEELDLTTNAAATYTAPTSSPTIPSSNGMNLDRIDTGMTAIFHKDVVRQCSEASAVPHGWESTLTVGGATTSVDIAVNSTTGYPLEIPYDNGTDAAQLCRTTMLTVNAGSYPTGTYTIKYSGDGDITLTGDASGSHTHNGVGEYSAEFTVSTPSSTGIILTFTRSSVSNPISGLRIILPGYAATYQSAPYYPPMISDLALWPVLRFMDPLRTNGQFQLVNWSDRITQSYYTNGTSKGMCYEDMVGLCNAANCHLWVCVPHLASDDFITKLFTLIFHGTVDGVSVCTPLSSNLNVYVEYCNEAWNADFNHYNQINNLGLALWPAQSAANAGRRYYAKRAARIFRLAEDAAGSTNNRRIVKVLSGQASSTTVITTILAAFAETTLDGVEVNPDGIDAHAIAIAPYLGAATAGSGTNWGDTTFTQGLTTVAQVLALGSATMIPSAATRVASHKTIADASVLGPSGGALDLIAYEAGANAVANVNQSDATLNTLMNATLRDQGMYSLYTAYLAACRGAGMKLMCHYSQFRALSNANKYGIREHMEQDVTTAWRYRAWQGLPFHRSSTAAMFAGGRMKWLAAKRGRRGR